MPLYDFRCGNCGEQFEELVSASELPPCPACGAPDPERLLGSFAGPFTIGLRGAAARRSNAARRVREEQRREARARRKEQSG
jgi:putative FmdB family regulatory protein